MLQNWKQSGVCLKTSSINQSLCIALLRRMAEITRFSHHHLVSSSCDLFQQNSWKQEEARHGDSMMLFIKNISMIHHPLYFSFPTIQSSIRLLSSESKRSILRPMFLSVQKKHSEGLNTIRGFLIKRREPSKSLHMDNIKDDEKEIVRRLIQGIDPSLLRTSKSQEFGQQNDRDSGSIDKTLQILFDVSSFP